MFIDSREIPESHTASADLCIIGGGAAGIITALEFLNKQRSVILIESGGFNGDEATQALYDGQHVGVPYAPLDTCRSRFFGGSTNSWAGWCRPLDTFDFQHRPWVNESGWPFSRDELMSYYGAAQSRLQLGPFDYDTASWEKRLARSKASFLRLPVGPIENVVNQLSPPRRALGNSIARRSPRRRTYVYSCMPMQSSWGQLLMERVSKRFTLPRWSG